MEAIQLRDNFVLKLADQEMAGKISSDIKKQGDAYTAEKALEKACELQQNKAANTFLQQTVKYEPIENQVLAMRSQRTKMATTKSTNGVTIGSKCHPNKLNNLTIGENGSAKDGHFTRACLAKNFKHRVQSLQAKQETEMDKYEDNPAARYQASQIKVCAKVNQVKELQEPPVDKKIVTVTVLYTRNQNEEAKDCLRMRVDTCADINIMPLSVYQTIFNDPKKEKLLPTGIQVTTYNDSTLDLIGDACYICSTPKPKKKLRLHST